MAKGTARLIRLAAWTVILRLAVLPQSSQAQSQVIINEIDYVQPGSPDSLEWIELHNLYDTEWIAGSAFLVFYHVDPNGQCHEYKRIDLQPMQLIPEGDYAVIGTSPCSTTFVSLGGTKDVIGNGPRDAIVLEQFGRVFDSVEYEAQSAQSSCGLVATSVGDSHSVPGSMQRCKKSGWVFSSTPTPCAPNTCAVSDVPPRPATPWGFVKTLYR